MAKPRRRAVPVRRVRIRRGDDGWELVKQIDLPTMPVPTSVEPPAEGVWAEAVDRHDDVLFRVLGKDHDATTVDLLVPIDARCVALDLHDGGASSEPIARIDLTGATSGAPPRRR